MHRRDYRLIARVIADTAQDEEELNRWTSAFSWAFETSPDNFDSIKFANGVQQFSNEVRAGGAPRAGGAQRPPAASTEGRADPAQPSGFGASQVLADEFDDAPQHFADENTPADHYYRS